MEENQNGKSPPSAELTQDLTMANLAGSKQEKQKHNKLVFLIEYDGHYFSILIISSCSRIQFFFFFFMVKV